MIIAKLEAYRTSDGAWFEDPDEAMAHQHGVDLTPEVEKYVGHTLYSWQHVGQIIEWEKHKKLKQIKQAKGLV
jgi:hypothetical protein